jgi:hypothetical protein
LHEKAPEHAGSPGEKMEAVPRPSHVNERAARRLGNSLRKTERLDPIGEAAAVLLTTLAIQLDKAVNGLAPAYNVERVANSYRATLELLADRAAPDPEDPFAALLAEMSQPSKAEDDGPWP